MKTKEALETRIAILNGRGAHNYRIIRKLQRQLRALEKNTNFN